MNTTIEIPEEVAALAQREAAKHKLNLPEFLTRAIEEKAKRSRAPHYFVNGVDMGPFDFSTLGPPPSPEVVAKRMESFGALSHLHEETLQIMDLIDETFGTGAVRIEKEAES